MTEDILSLKVRSQPGLHSKFRVNQDYGVKAYFRKIPGWWWLYYLARLGSNTQEWRQEEEELEANLGYLRI